MLAGHKAGEAKYLLLQPSNQHLREGFYNTPLGPPPEYGLFFENVKFQHVSFVQLFTLLNPKKNSIVFHYPSPSPPSLRSEDCLKKCVSPLWPHL